MTEQELQAAYDRAVAFIARLREMGNSTMIDSLLMTDAKTVFTAGIYAGMQLKLADELEATLKGKSDG